MRRVTEMRVFGPPGTGKTTFVQRHVKKAAQRVGSENIVVASFTRAAAAELIGRNLPVERSQVGTLHALCYRVLDRPEIAETRVDDWNANTIAPYKLSGGRSSNDLNEPSFESFGQTDGDRLHYQTQALRARMIDRARWPVQARRFFEQWEAWKDESGLLDFTDMIEHALDFIPTAPGDPTFGFFDEVQDFTKLELTLVRKWGRSMRAIMLAGDDDQCLYDFKGADPDAFLDPPIPDDQKRVLGQSYRVPRTVQRLSSAWIEQLERREVKEYAPRDFDGELRQLPGHYRVPDIILEDAERYVERGKSVMILASCGYMLHELTSAMREAGLPFHNPYSRSRGQWNPLSTRDDVTSSGERLLAFLRPQNDVWGSEARMWTADDVKMWASWLKARGNIRHGKKKTLLEWEWDGEITVEQLLQFLEDDAVSAALTGDLDWYLDNILARHRKAIDYPLKVYRRHGRSALTNDPPYIIGTGHSVKGGQSDVVYIAPDLSRAGMREWTNRNPDPIVRLFYVMMTRARESLIICEPMTVTEYVDLEAWVRNA